jgi:hypothetical protein
MSKRHATTAARKRPAAPAPDRLARVILKLQPEPPPSDDLAAYLESPDGASAEFWQAVALAGLRRHVGRPLSVATYARVRAALAEAVIEYPAAAGEQGK